MREARQRLAYEVVLRRRRGQGLRAISRALEIDRRTVRRILRDMEKRRSEGDDAVERELAARRAPRPSKLDDYADVVAELIARYPDIRATRVHEELTARGFDGGYTIVREYLLSVRPKTRARAFDLVETAPGRQAQVDWSLYRLADGTPIYCFSCVLSYSRHLYAHFCSDMRQVSVFRQLRAAFDFHGGVPAECVFDSMPGIVDRWELDQPILNLRAVDFAAFYDFRYHIAPRADGAYKGKVERPFRYIEESLLNGRTLHTLDEANAAMRWWLDHRANVRTHRTLKQRPVDRLGEEVDHLQALPARAYDDREMAFHVVDSYAYVRFDGNAYRAPARLVGHWVYVRADQAEVQITDRMAEVVARHRRAARNAGLHVPPPQARPKRRPVAELLNCFDAWGPSARAYAEKVKESKRYAGRELGAILAMQKTYSTEDLLAAIEHAHRYGAWAARDLDRILKRRARPRTLADGLAAHARDHVERAMAETPVEQRTLDSYAELLDDEQGQPDDTFAALGDAQEDED